MVSGPLDQGEIADENRGLSPTRPELPPGEHQFRYRIGDDWFNDSSADRTVEKGMGGRNSVVVVDESPGERDAASSPAKPRRAVW